MLGITPLLTLTSTCTRTLTTTTQLKIYNSAHHETSEKLPSFPPSSLSPLFGLCEAVKLLISGDGARAAMNENLLQRHYMRFEFSVRVDYSHASPPPAATIARRASALCSVADLAFPIDVCLAMSTPLWIAGVSKRLKEFEDAISQVSVDDRFLSKARIPNAVWVEMLGKAARLISAIGRTSASISAACRDHLLQLQHSNAATAALKELACPSRPAEMQVKRLRLIKDWLSQRLTKDRRTGKLKPTRSRDKLRDDIFRWNTANGLTRGHANFLNKRGTPDVLLQRLAEAAVHKSLATQDVIAAQERMSSCPGLGTNEVPPAGIPPSEWSSTSSRGKEILLAAAAMRGSAAAHWFRDRAQLTREVELEERNLHDDERDCESEASDGMDYEAMAMEHDV